MKVLLVSNFQKHLSSACCTGAQRWHGAEPRSRVRGLSLAGGTAVRSGWCPPSLYMVQCDIVSRFHVKKKKSKTLKNNWEDHLCSLGVWVFHQMLWAFPLHISSTEMVLSGYLVACHWLFSELFNRLIVLGI